MNLTIDYKGLKGKEIDPEHIMAAISSLTTYLKEELDVDYQDIEMTAEKINPLKIEIKFSLE